MPAINYIRLIHILTSQPALIKLYNENIGGHRYTFTTCLPQFGSKDQTAVCINFKNSNKEYTTVVASIYMPTDSTLPAP